MPVSLIIPLVNPTMTLVISTYSDYIITRSTFQLTIWFLLYVVRLFVPWRGLLVNVLFCWQKEKYWYLWWQKNAPKGEGYRRSLLPNTDNARVSKIGSSVDKIWTVSTFLCFACWFQNFIHSISWYNFSWPKFSCLHLETLWLFPSFLSTKE